MSLELRAIIAESETKYRSLIQNSLDNITVIQSEGTIRYENPSIQQILVFALEELEGENIFEFVHPEDVSKTKALFTKVQLILMLQLF